jgi:serine phosphatase RsbU (regulator of sigma subunit)
MKGDGRMESAPLSQMTTNLSEDILKRVFRDAFVLFRPKDIVSGDFYWIKEKKGKALFAAVDCTGHGVPGAFVSIIGNNGLNRSINEYELTEPAKILDRLAIIVEEAFVAEGSDVKDGMDIALCSLDRENMKLEFAGANNPLYIIRNEELIEIKGDKQPIGQFDKRRPYTNHVIDLQPNDIIYVFTDGYADQFGGPENKKFKVSRLNEMFEFMHGKPSDFQVNMLDTTLKKWMGDEPQVDDILIMGIRIS